jgi:hypothetical protein
MKYPLPAATYGHRTATCIIHLAGVHKIPVAQIIREGVYIEKNYNRQVSYGIAGFP